MALLIDTHTHIYLDEFQNEKNEIIARALQNGICKMVLPAISQNETAQMSALKQEYPNRVFLMAGLHPCSVNEHYKQQLEFVQFQLKKESFVAVGEIGLDFYWDISFANFQLDAFMQQMQWALDYKLPIVIHARNAMNETINAVKPFADRGLQGVFHCFGDSFENATRIIDMGFYLGIGGVITYKKSGLAETIAKIGLEHIVLETDSPYLAPVPYRGKRNESAYLKIIAEKVAEVKGITLEDVANITTANAEKIFSLTTGA